MAHDVLCLAASTVYLRIVPFSAAATCTSISAATTALSSALACSSLRQSLSAQSPAISRDLVAQGSEFLLRLAQLRLSGLGLLPPCSLACLGRVGPCEFPALHRGNAVMATSAWRGALGGRARRGHRRRRRWHGRWRGGGDGQQLCSVRRRLILLIIEQVIILAIASVAVLNERARRSRRERLRQLLWMCGISASSPAQSLCSNAVDASAVRTVAFPHAHPKQRHAKRLVARMADLREDSVAAATLVHPLAAHADGACGDPVRELAQPGRGRQRERTL